MTQSSVTSIGNYAFEYCSGLTSITIGNGVTSIGDSAFYYCGGLTKVNITDIDAWCNINFGDSYSNPLYYAKKLYINNRVVTNAVISDAVSTINDYAFFFCTALTSITIPDSVTSIGEHAFSDCSGLTSIVIPNTVTEINKNAFYSCSNLAMLFFTGSEEEWTDMYIASGNDVLSNAEIIYNAARKTYKFETNCGTKLADITDYAIAEMPMIENGDKTLLGWYDNKNLTGSPVTFPYYGSATTLYAAWTDKTGLSFDDAFTAKANMKYPVTIAESNQLIYYEFVPRLTGEYRFYSTGSLDTYGYLYDSNKRQLTSNDNGGSGNNFKITYNLTAGETYYIAAKLYSGTGSFELVTETDCIESTKTVCVTASSGEKIFITIPSYIPENACIILSCYNGDKLVETKYAPNKNETIYFVTTADFDSAKVMVWESFANAKPLCEVEIVK